MPAPSFLSQIALSAALARHRKRPGGRARRSTRRCKRARRRRQSRRHADAELERLDVRLASRARARFQAAMNKTVRHQHPRQLPARRRHGAHHQHAGDRTFGRPEGVVSTSRSAPRRSRAGAQGATTFEAVDWKKYLPGRITDEMVEMERPAPPHRDRAVGATYTRRSRR